MSKGGGPSTFVVIASNGASTRNSRKTVALGASTRNSRTTVALGASTRNSRARVAFVGEGVGWSWGFYTKWGGWGGGRTKKVVKGIVN